MIKKHKTGVDALINIVLTVCLLLTTLFFSLYLRAEVVDLNNLITLLVSFTLENLYIIIAFSIVIFIILSVKKNANVILRDFKKSKNEKTNNGQDSEKCSATVRKKKKRKKKKRRR